eukprot:TRINITY_DN1662_c0_g1_i2.p1 TRINITY_DN1662_c0_g1~~TRINITY_DN1662_c0_g1_i2.p1  ORF type:complete len:113 (+),score=41.63 TRINITY_DN1662_c0_g1_i2:48-341(+)
MNTVLPKAVQFIADHKQRGNKVLVHCMAGISRSTTVVIAYLIAHEGWTLQKSWHHVLSRRRIAYPNPGFWALLNEWEKVHRGPDAAGCFIHDRQLRI